MKKAKYGIDAPGVIIGLVASALFSVAVGVIIVHFFAKNYPVAAWAFLWLSVAMAAFNLFEIIMMLYSSYKGKAKVLAQMIQDMRLEGKVRILDMGCGRGMLTAMLAKAMPESDVVGVDIWKFDQSGNAIKATEANMEIEGVKNVQIQTADMQELPFEDDHFDLVFASLSIHNIQERHGRERALIEAARVLKPGGKVAILDFQKIKEYKQTLGHLHCENIVVSKRFFCTFPHMRTVYATISEAPPQNHTPS